LKFRSLQLAALCCAATVLAGCASSPIPLAENFQLTSQKKVRSAGHWQLLSRDVVAQTLDMLDKASVPAQSTLHIVLPEHPTEFDTAFHEFLVTELVNSGRRVVTSGDTPLSISYQTQVVRHDSERPYFIPGKYTAIATGLSVLHGINRSTGDAAVIGGLALAGAADYLSSVNAGGPTHTELILTTTVKGAGRYMARKTDVYYIEQDDAGLFSHTYRDPSRLGVKPMKVVAQ